MPQLDGLTKGEEIFIRRRSTINGLLATALVIRSDASKQVANERCSVRPQRRGIRTTSRDEVPGFILVKRVTEDPLCQPASHRQAGPCGDSRA